VIEFKAKKEEKRKKGKDNKLRINLKPFQVSILRISIYNGETTKNLTANSL